MSNSKLVNYRLNSPNYSVRRGTIKNIIVHHMAGCLTVENCCYMFAQPSRQASSHYCIDSNGRVGQSVDEAYRAWTTGNVIDHDSITIEVANDQVGEPWHVSDIAFAKLVDLCADICKRNGIKKLNYTGGKDGNLLMHKWYQATGCPGTYLGSKFPAIASMVNAKLLQNAEAATLPAEAPKTIYRVRLSANDAASQLGAYGGYPSSLQSAKDLADAHFGYKVYDGTKLIYTGKQQPTTGRIVKVEVSDLRIRAGAGLSYVSKGYIKPGKYTIVEERDADGLTWGRLKSGAGWIALKYTEKI